MRAAAKDSLARAALDPPELFDVDVDELAGTSPLIALRGSWPSRPNRPIPIRVRIPDTVESGISSTSAISGPVIRNLRSPAITAIRRSSVRFATRTHAELRSSSPDSEASRNLDTHLEHVLGDVLNSAAAP